MASSSSCQTISTSSSSYRKHDVFISFRGKDTRNGFTSHLHKALDRAKIDTFVDYKLIRGEEISESLLNVIRGSKVSIIIFSENYADSEWCLEELVEIIDCKRKSGQIVIPVFYQVDPSHVQDITHTYQDAFNKHQQRFNDDMLDKWKTCLFEASNLSGWDSLTVTPEARLIEKTVEDVLKKLNRMSEMCDSLQLVGIDSRLMEIEALMDIDSPGIQTIGIWGMGGSGKTAVAKAMFNRICNKYEAHYFIENTREKLKSQDVSDLRNEIVSKVLDDSVCINSSKFENLELAYVKQRLRRKKVLIVLDNVDDWVRVQDILGGKPHKLFGAGSRIVLTSRDKKVLEDVSNSTYQVKELNKHEALQLFCLYAFKKNYPIAGYSEFTERVLDYAKGNPFALIVLGSALHKRTEEDWISALEKLDSNAKIRNILKISYNGLHGDQKKVFLDIACFFRGHDYEFVSKILDGCYSSVRFTIRILQDKFLVSISPQNKVEMHDLVQEMAWSIVREESLEEPGKRSRLWIPEDVYNTLNKKKGTGAIEGIFYDLSAMKDQLQLSTDVFEGLDQLKLLKIYVSNASIVCNDRVQLPRRGLKCLSDKLSYLHWHRYPADSLPSTFCPKYLVELNLPYSKIKHLWTVKQDLAKLKRMDLRHSENLKKLPDLSGAPSIETICLQGCNNLMTLPQAIQHLENLEYLDLSHCESLKYVPSIDSECLKVLDLSYCLNVKRCPELKSRQLEELDLSWTLVEEVPKRVENSEVLRVVRLIGCSNITKFPEVSSSIKELYLSATSISTLPKLIENFTELITLDMSNCKRLSTFQCSSLSSVKKALMEGQKSSTSLPSTISNLSNNLRNFQLRDHIKTKAQRLDISSALGSMISLKFLNLRGFDFEYLPESLKYMSQLEFLDISFCKRLRCLPELPPSLEVLDADNCKALEDISNCSNFKILNFANCLKMEEKARKLILANAIFTIQLVATKSRKDKIPVQYLLPGDAIPYFFSDRSIGSTITRKLPDDWRRFNGMAFCIVIGPEDTSLLINLVSAKLVSFGCRLLVKSNNSKRSIVICDWERSLCDLNLVKGDHALMWYDPCTTPFEDGIVSEQDWFNKYSGCEVTFEFYVERWLCMSKHCAIKRCGVRVL